MEFDPPEVRRAGTELDALAARLEDTLRVNLPALAVEPAGVDEVSVRAADTLRGVASSYDDAATRGVHEIRKLAAALRWQTDQLVQMDEDNAGGFGVAT
ncbi:PE family protein [Nocardia sp. NBC_01329]|uniref:PE family protein n=1 Tax=Nocardia sp. NBC_01329 TaxID=2903594 RepID=UPI002E1422D7|nr:PE family protein [Nocardia sp. NBC_01329]